MVSSPPLRPFLTVIGPWCPWNPSSERNPQSLCIGGSAAALTTTVRGVDLSRVNICSQEMGNKSLKGYFGILFLQCCQRKHVCLSECLSWISFRWIAWMDCHVQAMLPGKPFLLRFSSAELSCCDLPLVKGYRVVSLFLRVTGDWYCLVPGCDRSQNCFSLCPCWGYLEFGMPGWTGFSTSLCFRREMLLHQELCVHVGKFIVSLVNEADGIILSHL